MASSQLQRLRPSRVGFSLVSSTTSSTLVARSQVVISKVSSAPLVLFRISQPIFSPSVHLQTSTSHSACSNLSARDCSSPQTRRVILDLPRIRFAVQPRGTQRFSTMAVAPCVHGIEQRIATSPVSLPFSSPVGLYADPRLIHRVRVKVSEDAMSLSHPLTASRHVSSTCHVSAAGGGGLTAPTTNEQSTEEKHAREAPEGSAESERGDKKKKEEFLTLPTMLTLARVVAVPAIIPAFYLAPGVATAIFLVASFTDWLDGYLARKMNLSSSFGAFLDPVADKLMVAALLVLLCTEPPPPVALLGLTLPGWTITLPAIAMIGREIAMSAVREWAAAEGGKLKEVVAVSGYGKWKTATQMAAITVLLALRSPSVQASALAPLLGSAGMLLLYTAATLAVSSFTIYLRSIARFLAR